MPANPCACIKDGKSTAEFAAMLGTRLLDDSDSVREYHLDGSSCGAPPLRPLHTDAAIHAVGTSPLGVGLILAEACVCVETRATSYAASLGGRVETSPPQSQPRPRRVASFAIASGVP